MYTVACLLCERWVIYSMHRMSANIGTGTMVGVTAHQLDSDSSGWSSGGDWRNVYSRVFAGEDGWVGMHSDGRLNGHDDSSRTAHPIGQQ